LNDALVSEDLKPSEELVVSEAKEEPKPITFYEKKMQDYKEEVCKSFRTNALDWKPRPSALEQAKSAASPRVGVRSGSRDTQKLHYEAWGMGQAPSLVEVFSNKKLSKLEQDKLASKKHNEERTSVNPTNRHSHGGCTHGAFMADVMVKKSKLE